MFARQIAGMCVAVTIACAACTPTEEAREGLTEDGSYYVFWDSIPGEIPFNDNFQLSVMVHDGADNSVMLTDVELEVDATMPAHGHGMETEPTVEKSEMGMFTVDGMLFHMAGDWELVLTPSGSAGVESARFAIDCCG